MKTMKSTKRKYLLTIKLEFEAFDDIEARQIAKDNLGYEFNLIGGKVEAKLQNIFENKEPRRVEMDVISN